MRIPHGIFDYKIEIGGAPAPSYPTDGLCYRWSFDSSLTADPVSISPAIWTPYGTVDFSTNKIEGVGSMWGHSGKVRCGDASVYNLLKGTNSWSIVIWYNRLSSTGWFYGAGDLNNQSPYPRTLAYFSGTACYTEMKRDTSKKTLTLSKTLSANTYYMYVLRYQGGAGWWAHVWPDASGYVAHNEAQTSSVFNGLSLMGPVFNTTEQNTQNCVDVMYLYNKSLSEAEMAQLWNNGAGV